MLGSRRDKDEKQPLLQSEPISYNTNYERIQENESSEDFTMGADIIPGDGPIRAKHLPQYIATISATTGAFAAGSVLGWSSPAEYPILNSVYGFHVNYEQWSWIGSIATLGGIISCLLIGLCMDLLGRKTTMLLLIIPFSIGWANLIWPISVLMLYIGRFFVGFAGGAFFVVAPGYIGEIASKDIRGTLSSCLQLMVTAGILFVYVIGSVFTFHTFNYVCAILPIIFGLIFVWCPESPYFYVMKNRRDDAEKSLKWLRGENYSIIDELTEIQMEHDLMARNRTNFVTAFKKSSSRRALMISLTLLFLTQMSGINAVIFYTESIFEKAGAGIDSSMATIAVGVMQFVATFIASMTVDKFGRKLLLSISASIMSVCNIGLGIYFYLLDHNSAYIQNLNWLPISSLCVYIIAFSIGLGPVPWVLVSEIFATEVKAIASSLSGSTSWLIAFLVTKFFSNVRDAIGAGPTFFAFSIFAALCLLFVRFKVPETQGKSFNEIQRLLQVETYSIDETDDDNTTTITNASQNTIAI